MPVSFDENTSVGSGPSGRTFNLLKCEYAFEELDDGMPRIPLAAQRSLDASGRRLTVDGWRSLSPADQKIMMLAGAADAVDSQLVESIVIRAKPPATTCDRVTEPGRYDLPAILIDALGRSRPLDIDRWAGATALDRYVLMRLRIDPDELSRAYDEIFTSTLVQTQTLPRFSAMPPAFEPAPKAPSLRRAVATSRIQMRPELLSKIIAGKSTSDVLSVARTAGMLGAKRAHELIPLCATSQVTRVDIGFAVDPHGNALIVRAKVEAFASGPLTSEALLAASTAALTIVDLMRVADRWMTISQVRLEEMSGGEAGELKRPT